MIRSARKDEKKVLYELYKSHELDWKKLDDENYRINIQRSGFLFGTDDFESFSSLIENSIDTVVYEEKGQICGFVVINHETYFSEDNKAIIWIQDVFKEKYFSKQETAAIYFVVVDSSKKKKGIAKQLIQYVEKDLPKKHITNIISLIQINPLVNMPSITFHAKMGYEVWAISRPEKKQFEKYMCMIVGKQC